MIFYFDPCTSKVFSIWTSDLSLPYFFHIFKYVAEVGFPPNCVSPCSTHAKTSTTGLFCLPIETDIFICNQKGQQHVTHNKASSHLRHFCSLGLIWPYYMGDRNNNEHMLSMMSTFCKCPRRYLLLLFLSLRLKI